MSTWFISMPAGLALLTGLLNTLAMMKEIETKMRQYTEAQVAAVPSLGLPVQQRSFFISSAYANDAALHEIRVGIHEWAEARKISHWMFEHARDERAWANTPLNQSIATCLSELARCDTYVGFIHEVYGRTRECHVANVAFTELEAFHAIRLRKRMLFYVVEPSPQRDPDSEAFLAVLQHIAPESIKGVGSVREVLSWAKNDMLELSQGRIEPATVRLGRFLDRTSMIRWSMLTGIRGLLLARSNDDQDLAASVSDDYIRRMSGLSELPTRDQELQLSSMLPAIRKVSWRASGCSNGQRVLDEFCERWHNATVWHDNHYYGDCGCLATKNTQMFVRCLQAMGDEARTIDRLAFLELNDGLGSREWIRVYVLGSSISSSYYSLGKQLPSGRRRRYLLDHALRWAYVARKVQSKVDDPDNYGAALASITGHVCWARGAIDEAMNEFRTSLDLRTSAGADTASLAEAKGDLGYLLALNGSRRIGVRMVEEAASEMGRSVKEAYASRIKLKLADLYLRRLRVSAAFREVAEADAICRCHGASLRAPATWRARVVLQAIRHVARPLTATATDAGYVFD